VRAQLPSSVRLLLVPTDYTSTTATPYLDELAAGLPPDVGVAWTGPTVVCDRITVADALDRAAVLGGRPPVIWDNYPCNDTLMADQLFLGPLRGRDPGLVDASSGYLANPLTQPRASLLPLTSTAAYLSGSDPDAAWSDEADARGWRVFAECADGAQPRLLVERLTASEPGTSGWGNALAALRAWLKDAASCTALELESEVQPWLDQAHAEAEVCMTAVRLLEQLSGTGARATDAPDPAGASDHAMVLAFTWRQAQRSAVTVFGPRVSFRPVLSHRSDATWQFHRESLLEGLNATDLLVRYALDLLGAA
jgi:hyaluronoglucosaminidase